MPTYNGQRYIKEALDSLLTQDYTDFEILVVIDGSTDNTLSILKQYSDPEFDLLLRKTMKACRTPLIRDCTIQLASTGVGRPMTTFTNWVR